MTLSSLCRTDDELAKYMHTRPLECNVLSRRSIDSAGECLQTCLESHEKCRIEWTKSLRNAPSLANSLAGEPLSGEVLKTDELPNRLLCKYEEGGELKLRLVDAPRTAPFEKSHNCASGFATLSYCWGGRNTNQLTYETKALLSSGLVTSLLPPTLRGIVKFAHDMTLEYNWIDALYIFQDSPEDKNREIPRMGLYYGNYTLTLCAASSANSGSGLSSYQTPSTFGEGVFRLQYRFGDVAGYLRCHEPMNAREPLTTRDWTLQGSLLS